MFVSREHSVINEKCTSVGKCIARVEECSLAGTAVGARGDM